MELPKLGQQCSHKDCKQLDFLPLRCKCGKIFCSEHFKLHCQECETAVDVQVTELNKFQSYKCSRDDCNETSVVPIVCQRCHKHFCIKHRHLTQCEEKDPLTLAEEKEKAEAPVRRFNEAKKQVDEQIEHSLSEAKKRGKNTNLVNKVQLMKIKNKAKGLKTIPTTDRVYFSVSHTNSVCPVFVSKIWSLGRAIDAIADECGVKNENNKSTGKKLRLFKKENGAIVSDNLAETLEILMTKNVLLDGESLVLDYLKDL